MDIPSYCFQVTFAHSNRPVIILPGKFMLQEPNLVYPKRGFAFNKLSYFADVLFFSERDQTMSVFLVSIDTIEPYIFCLGISFDVLKHHSPNLFFLKKW